jgi:hypothetical protein
MQLVLEAASKRSGTANQTLLADSWLAGSRHEHGGIGNNGTGVLLVRAPEIPTLRGRDAASLSFPKTFSIWELQKTEKYCFVSYWTVTKGFG